MLIIGLTGGVASGKNFVASQFEKLKIPVFDADLQVHKLLASNKEVFLLVKQNFPKAIIDDRIDRKLLGAEVFKDKNKLQKLEQIIYPFLQKEEDLFIKNCRVKHHKIVLLNIPLLFEKSSQKNSSYNRCDKSIAVIVSPLVQFQRFKKRLKLQNNFEHDTALVKFKNITNHQLKNQQRKVFADFLIYNGLSKIFTTKQVKNIIPLLLK
jgi:dephospho-CoA kinase